jgi:hypothetical protein
MDKRSRAAILLPVVGHGWSNQNKKKRLADFEMYEGHHYTIRTAPRTCITAVLFVD